ncbi:MAG: amidase [Actinomycetota bacterium]
MFGVDYIGATASEIAEHVRSGKVSPLDVVRAHLDRIEALDARFGAFQVIRRERALEEAAAVAARADLAELPLAGVPIAIKDNIAVEGEPKRDGSVATPEDPQTRDHELVRRVRAAGAVVVGITRIPELAIWPTTDGPFGTARNPWNTQRTPGGSSGGAGAALASAMVPLAQGNDGGGSIRIPSAACGLFGLKPGPGVVPGLEPPGDWHGMAENGPMATTVDDAALLLSVMAGQPSLASVEVPARALRIAVDVRSPLAGVSIQKEWKAAARDAGALLEQAGHTVSYTGPRYPTKAANAFLARWFVGVAEDAEAHTDPSKLQRRTRGHVRAGRFFGARLKEGTQDRWRAHYERFFSDFDLLVSPGLARTPPKAEGWSTRGWLINLLAATRYAPMSALWNLVGFPAASIPLGIGPNGMPLGVQIVAPRGGEALLLSVAKQLEQVNPWQRHAPAV